MLQQMQAIGVRPASELTVTQQAELGLGSLCNHMKIFGYNNFSTVRTPFNGTIDAIDRPSQEYRELPFQ